MQIQRLTFSNHRGQQLAARLDWPLDRPAVAFALFAHCFTCTKNLNAIVNVSRGLTREGLAVLRFDFTGLGDSEGEFADTGFSSNVDDLIAAAQFMAANFQAPQLLIGHSLGGAAVLQAAAAIPSARAVATIGAPADTAHLVGLFADRRRAIEAEGEAEVVLAGRSFRIRREFLEDLERTRMEDTIRTLGRPLLLLHSPEDAVVAIENAERIFHLARYPKSLVALDGADHLLTNKRDSLYVGSLLGHWAKKYLDLEAAEAATAIERNPGVTARTGALGYRTEITAGQHHLLADEPVPAGGSDTGPTPYQLLAAALGACTSITLRMVADRKQWPLKSMEVKVRHARVHAEDCAECRGKGDKVEVFDRELSLEGDLSAEQKARLMEIADRCPVHKILHDGVVVRTQLI